MLKLVALLALFGFFLGGCSSLPKGPISELEFGANHPLVRPALVPFDSADPDDIIGSIVVPLPIRTPLATGKDPLADDGRHLRVQLTIGAEGTVHIDSVTVGPGAARAYLSDSQDLVVSLVSTGGEPLASVGVRQPLVEYVYPKLSAKTDREGVTFSGQHGKRLLSAAPVTVFLPSIAGAERVEVRLGGDKGRVVAAYKLQ